MKKIYTLSLMMFAAVSFAQTFSFPGTGALTLAANGWTTHSGTAAQQTILATASDSGNSLFRTGLPASTGNRTSIIAGNGEDVNIPLTAPITTGTVYFSALVKFLDSSTLTLNTSTGDYFLSFTSVVSATTTAFHGRIYAKQGATANTVSLGVLNNSGGTVAPTFAATDVAINVTHLLVLKYDMASATASLYINPTSSTEPTTAAGTNATGTTTAPTQTAGFVIRQGGTATAGTGNVEIDEIRVAVTFAAVAPVTLSTTKNEISGLKIYPNPVKDGVLYIDTQANADKNVTVFDILGKQVINVSTTSNTVNVSNLKDGVYFVKITEAGKTATRKLVINN